MAHALAPSSNCLKLIEWMWQASPDPFSKTKQPQWSHYSDVENLIIEDAYTENKAQAVLDEYYIDLKRMLQISKVDGYKQRPVKRVVRKREDKHLREERFMDLPVDTGRLFGGEYGFVAPFVIEVRRTLNLQPDDLPSKKPELIPVLVEKAAEGIVKEGTHMNKKYEANKLATMLLEKKNERMEEVWKCCAYLYSLESFLYKTLNAAMRLVGNKEQEQVWRSKVRTLGPFCLLLWDDPINKKGQTKKTLYRGAKLKLDQIAQYEEMAKDKSRYGSFQAFSSCTRNPEKAKEFGNVLFIMEVDFAFMADISEISEYSDEEEELVVPGVCFRVQRVEFDEKIKKHLIYLRLRQRFSSKQNVFLSTCSNMRSIFSEYFIFPDQNILLNCVEHLKHNVDDSRFHLR